MVVKYEKDTRETMSYFTDENASKKTTEIWLFDWLSCTMISKYCVCRGCEIWTSNQVELEWKYWEDVKVKLE